MATNNSKTTLSDTSPTEKYTCGCAVYCLVTVLLILVFPQVGFEYSVYILCAFLVYKLFVRFFLRFLIPFFARLLTRKRRVYDTVRRLIEGSQETLLRGFDQMDGKEFENACVAILRANGYRNIQTTPASGDYGVDILCNDGALRYAVQCKRYSDNVGLNAVQEVSAGARHYGCIGSMVMTNSRFTKQAIELAHSNNVTLIDRDCLYAMCDTNNRGKNLAEAGEIARAYENLFWAAYHLRIKVSKYTTVFSKLNIVLYLKGEAEELEQYTQKLADKTGVCHELIFDDEGWHLHITRD